MSGVYSAKVIRESALPAMTNQQPEGEAPREALPESRLAPYDLYAGNVLQPREFDVIRRRAAVMSGSPFETDREDPFKAHATRGGRGRSKRMPKGITPPISDPFQSSAPTHAQTYLNPLQSKSGRLAARPSQQLIAAAAAASSRARAERLSGAGAARPGLDPNESTNAGNAAERARKIAPLFEPSAVEAQWSELPEARVLSIKAIGPSFAASAPVVMNSESDVPVVDRPGAPSPSPGNAPAPPHPAGPAVSEGAAAYYGERRVGGGGGQGGSGSGAGGGGRPPQRAADPIQDDLVAGALVAAFALLFGWLGYNAWFGDKPEAAPGATDASSRSTRSLAEIQALSAPNPLPAGPIDIRPTSALPEVNLDVAPTRLATEGLQLAQVESAPPPTEAAPPVAASCPSGRALQAYFCTARADITPAVRRTLEAELADWSTCGSQQQLVVRGYADTRGAVELNASLASRRATAVAEMLRGKGLSVVEVAGVGELSDIEDNRNCANQRRVDIALNGEVPPASRACTPPAEASDLICA